MPEETTPPAGSEVRALGVDVRAVIVRYRKLQMRTDAGVVYEFILLVRQPSGPNFLLQVGNPVPPAALELIVPGRELPAKLLERDKRALLIEWTTALAEAALAEAAPGAADDPDSSPTVRDNM